VTEPLASSDLGNQKRRSTRIVQAVPIVVTGVDALGQPFKERTTTVMVNCHGCKYQSKHYVPKNSIVNLEIPQLEPGAPPKTTPGRVVWVQRPRTVRELFQIGLEFEIAGNVWGIAFPPDDWFPLPSEEPIVTTAPPQAARPAPPPVNYSTEPVIPQKPVETTATVKPPIAAQPPAAKAPAAPTRPPAAAAPAQPPAKQAAPPAPAAPAPPTQPSQSKIHVVPSPAPSEESQAVLARHMARMVADAKEVLDKSLRNEAQTAINDEMTVVRQQLDVQLHDAVEKAIKVSMDRVSEATVRKVVQQAADRTASIVDEARKATQSGAEQLDAKVRQAVQEAVSGAAEQAAQQAAQQTAALSLKDAVQEAVEKAISEREAATPSLQILNSPEAAQKHLDQWKKDLEATAQDVRNQTVEQTQADAAAANRQWHEQFESALKGASQKISEQLTEVSQAALSQVEQDIAARSTSLRASLDEAIVGAESTISTLGASLAEERVRTEVTKAELQDAARSALEQTRQKLDEVLAQQYQEIGRKADQVIADRALQIEPILDQSARKVVERVSSDLEQKISSKLDEARTVASDLAGVRQQTADLQASVQAQVKEAADQVARLQDSIQDQVRQAAEQASQLQGAVQQQVQQASETAIQESLARLKEETAKYPAEFEQTCRESLSKVAEDLETKSTEMQHATYEALLKASEWYQKKAHTTMQGSLEKAVEQSTASLRDRAAEISSLVASELDHYRRTYLEHSQVQIEETAKEVLERERNKLDESAEIANATFTDRVRRTTDESLRRFDQASRQALEKARSDMEFNRDGSLAEFQTKIDDKIQQGVEQAKTYLQSQLIPLVETWESNRLAQQREWMEQLQKSTDESIEQYKTRLENASNSWLLASATTLGQHSQAVLDTIAKAAEKRLRETCKDVLAGMGDTLKERLVGLSSDFESDEEDDEPPAK
jgi:hypothetical protein